MHYDQSVQTAGVPQEMTRDDELRSQHEALLAEAAERSTFHRIELERWERVARASARCLEALHEVAPVAQATPEDFMPSAGKVAMPR